MTERAHEYDAYLFLLVVAWPTKAGIPVFCFGPLLAVAKRRRIGPGANVVDVVRWNLRLGTDKSTGIERVARIEATPAGVGAAKVIALGLT